MVKPSKRDIETLQRIENVVYRNILNVPKFTGVEFLRGEVGATSMKWRIIKGRLLYVHRKLTEDRNTTIKRIIKEDIELGNTEMGKRIRQEMQDLGLTNELETYSRREIIANIKEKDRIEWINGMRNKVTLRRYMENKVNIFEEKWFKNGNKFKIMMKSRSNTLNLKWRDWGSDEEKICPLCQQGIETLEHFILECPKLQPIRNKHIELQWPMQPNRKEENIKKILMFDIENNADKFDNIRYINLIEELWIKRKSIIKEQTLTEVHVQDR